MIEQNKNIPPAHMTLGGSLLRVDQLRPDASVIRLCQACGMVTDIAVAALQSTVPGYRAVEQIGHELPCRGCGMRGQATIDARRALAR